MGRLDLRDPARDEDVYRFVLSRPVPDKLLTRLANVDGNDANARLYGRKSDLKALRR